MTAIHDTAHHEPVEVIRTSRRPNVRPRRLRRPGRLRRRGRTKLVQDEFGLLCCVI